MRASRVALADERDAKVTTTKKVAVIGCGRWGHNLARNFHELGALGCVVDSAIPGREATIAASRIPYPLFANEDLLRAFDQVDAVAIATPAPTHYEIALAALRRGKDVLVEKPMALQLDHAQELVTVAKNRNLILAVGHVLE